MGRGIFVKINELKMAGKHNGCKNTPQCVSTVFSRREFLTAGTAAGIGLATGESGLGETMKDDTVEISFGVIADLHYADKDMAINRYYRESDEKLQEAIRTYNSLKPAFVIELGDLIDKAEKEIELGYLNTISSIYREFNGELYYVLGNHDLATISKEEFIRYCGARENYYSFDHGDCHFIVLDANYNKDGTDYNEGNFDWKESYINGPQQKWLKTDISQAQGKKILILVHQNLHDETNPHGVKNAPEVRSILEKAGNVIAVFQGHDHKGGYARINGIHYVTLRAAVEGSGLENNAYAMVNINADGGIVVKGYGKQESYSL